MRLTAHQTQANRQLTQQMGRAQTRVRVYGSRLDHSARSGEVDLMLEQPAPVDNPARMATRMTARVSRAMRGRKVDVLMIEPARFIRDSVRPEPCRSTALRLGTGRTGIRVDSCRSNSAPNLKRLPIHNIAFEEGQLL